MKDLFQSKLAVIGLGYVGLPLAVEFGNRFTTIGYDLNVKRIQKLRDGIDETLEVEKSQLIGNSNLSFTADASDIEGCDIYIVTVPTPIDRYKRPDLSPLQSASDLVGRCLSKGNIVIFESTVYPGATEEVCVPILERESGLEFNKDFYCGYSPERINPGDKEHRLPSIKKVTSGSTPEMAEFIDQLYASIITAGTHKASSIKVAEAAKVIENTQRDLNIALINELALIFNQMGIDTQAVLEAAGTKWNFLNFRPGLVGGHCIGVDPYYLTHKAKEIGYRPEVILAGRRINDGMGKYVADNFAKKLVTSGVGVDNAKVLLLGFTFKENCPDIRNTKVIDIYVQLGSWGISVDVYDPWANSEAAMKEYGINVYQDAESLGEYQGVIVAVGHDQFLEWDRDQLQSLLAEKGVIYDLKNVYPAEWVDFRL